MKQTDQELLQAISGGASTALSEFYDRHSKLIYGVVLRLLGDSDDAEDIVQEVFVQVWRKASTYKPELGSPKNWALRIAHNRALNLIRAHKSRGRKLQVSISDEESRVLSSPELMEDNLLSQTMSAERMEIISSAMQDLPKDQVMLIDMAFFQGYSHSEIADALGIPLGTIKTKIRNGLLSLRNSLSFMKGELAE
ncbi:MAG: sigma-70 family RNA polymerase sigma factor [bacterium]